MIDLMVGSTTNNANANNTAYQGDAGWFCKNLNVTHAKWANLSGFALSA